jgi:neurofibromin 1
MDEPNCSQQANCDTSFVSQLAFMGATLLSVITFVPSLTSNRCDPILSILDDVLLSGQNAATLQSAQMLLRSLTANPKLSGTVDTAQLLEEVLEDIGFGGLWRSSTFHAATERDRHCIVLTDKLIEVSIYSFHRG